ncbi:signal peptidase I [Arthrobacter sp. AFG7.2]|uniref:signal peptidase I n=1 Tax=Arthrobacter sp. AFG7.2 TaxID=1688693 RepID=UPI000C9DEA07|nr:signal peptidase I [Arthrobacter sp. AFG7.2]PNI10488.1 signal peptidase I [Arthrobacter sp. AFG7.2]
MAADLTERPLTQGAASVPDAPKAASPSYSKEKSTGAHALALLGRMASLAAMLVALFAASVLIVVPVVTASHTYTVLTNSMAPKFPPGTFLVMKPAPFSELKYGDVITFQLYSGRPEVETHRVVGFGATQTGEKTLITKGDNNGATDTEPVREIQVKGKLFYAVPYVGFLANALGNADRGLWTTVAAICLMGYGALLVLKSVRTSRRQDPVAGAG